MNKRLLKPTVPSFHRWEVILVMVILSIAFYFLQLRISHHCFPSGDEGSWMNVAAQLSRGEGFTTRWYEHFFLTHHYLPRPDDYRYPGLSLLLAAAFLISDISYQTALMTTALLFIVFLALYYLTIRKKYGTPTAVISLAATAFSLLQLYWNAAVYTEGLFAIGVCIVVSIAWFFNLSKMRTWVLLGLATALLYYIRFNGILFIAGFPAYLIVTIKRDPQCWKRIGIGFVVFIAATSPWMLRSLLLFDNPLHIAQGGGVLRLAASEPTTWTLFEFLSHYSPFAIMKATAIGTFRFFPDLHFFEKNLFILPLIGIAVSFIRQRSLGNIFVFSGFFLTVIASMFIAYNESWAAVRYMTPYLPFIYARGISELIVSTKIIALRLPPLIRTISPVVPGILLLSTLYYPHRYYIRYFTTSEPCNQSVSVHTALLDSLVNKDQYYLADKYGQYAFTSTRKCIGIQSTCDSAIIPLYLQRYKPVLLVLREDELTDNRIRAIMQKIKQEGFELDTAAQISDGVYFRIRALSSSFSHHTDLIQEDPIIFMTEGK